MSLVLVSSKRFVDHVTPAGHPERPERAETMEAVAAGFAAQGGTVLEPRLATDDDLERVHTPEHIESIAALPAGRRRSTKTPSPRRTRMKSRAWPPARC